MFERFTREARRAVVGAQEEARHLRHSWIGTEHLLLGLVQDEAGGAARALAAAGVMPEDVRAEVLAAVPAGESEPRGHIPFTPRAKTALELALREALRLKHRTIEPEHILLGLLREGEGVAAQVLLKVGPGVDALRQAVVQGMADWPDPALGIRVAKSDMPDMTRAGAAAFTRARQLAAGAPVGSQHLLRGLFGEEDSLALRTLTALGVTPEAVERELEHLDPADTADEPAEQAGARRTRLQVAGDVITMRLQDAQLASRLSQALQRLPRSSGEELEIAGTEPGAKEAFGRLWRALERASSELAGKLGGGEGAAPWRTDWRPPGWSTRASVAGYTVLSMPDGPESRLWTAEGVEEIQVRRFLARWLETGLPLRPGEGDAEPACTFFTVHVGRQGEVIPGTDDPDAWTVTSFSLGPGPAPDDWPRVPLATLVAFAAADLERPAAA